MSSEVDRLKAALGPHGALIEIRRLCKALKYLNGEEARNAMAVGVRDRLRVVFEEWGLPWNEAEDGAHQDR